MTFIDYFIIFLALTAVVVTILLSIKNKKEGKTSCGYNCGSCSKCKKCILDEKNKE